MAWQLIGGHVALDLVNTVAWRLDPERTVDRLTDPARLADWVAAALAEQVVGTDPALPGVLDRVRALRENLAGVLQAHLAGRPLPAPGMGALDQAWLEAVRAAPEPTALPIRRRVPVRAAPDLPHRLALESMDLLQDPRLERLRQCAGAGCGWLFLDSTRNHSRIWCDAQDCGNRARVRRYVARRRSRS